MCVSESVVSPRMAAVMENDDKPSELVVLINPAFSGKPNVKSMKIPFEQICRQMLLGAPAAKGPAPAHAPEAEGEWMGQIIQIHRDAVFF